MAKMSDKIIKEFFPHDYYPREDKKMIEMFFYFRKHKKDFPLEAMQDVLCFAAYGLYWAIVEYMHVNNAPLEEKNLDILADDLRVDPAFLHIIMENFDLFKKENNAYANDRVIRNVSYRQEKSGQNQEAANVRWIVSAFNKAYIEIFNEEPVLMPNEIETLKQYAKKIPNLKDKLRDIIYTMKFIKFDTKFIFKQRANWLLAKDKNNLSRILNGEYGPLKHKKTEEELKEEQKLFSAEETAPDAPDELELQLKDIADKNEALTFILDFHKSYSNLPRKRNGKIFVVPEIRKLMSKFEITDEEVIEKWQH